MKHLSRSLAIIALSGALFSTVSCVTSPPVHADVEGLERQAPVSDLPNTGDQDYIHAAERYSNPYSSGRYYNPIHGGYGNNYGTGYGYGRGLDYRR